MSADLEASQEELLRFGVEVKEKQLKELRAIRAAMQNQPQTIIENNIPQQPAPVVRFTPKPTTWHFQITARDSEGRIESFTATPAA